MAETETKAADEKKRPIWVGVAIVVTLVLVVAGVVWTSGILRSKEEVEVPDVVGMNLDAARDELEEAGLKVERTDRTYSVKQSEGTILAQSPSAGSVVPEGSELTLEVARGVEEGTVPDVSALDVEDAILAAEAAGYTVVIKEKVVKGKAPGTVLEQSPPEGEAKPGSEITLVVAVGAVPDVRTPNVVGSLQPAAVSILHEAGLKARSYWVSAPVSRVVVAQYPPAGMMVAPGTVTELSVGAGYDNPTLPMGGIIGTPK